NCIRGSLRCNDNFSSLSNLHSWSLSSSDYDLLNFNIWLLSNFLRNGWIHLVGWNLTGSGLSNNWGGIDSLDFSAVNWRHLSGWSSKAASGEGKKSGSLEEHPVEFDEKATFYRKLETMTLRYKRRKRFLRVEVGLKRMRKRV